MATKRNKTAERICQMALSQPAHDLLRLARRWDRRADRWLYDDAGMVSGVSTHSDVVTLMLEHAAQAADFKAMGNERLVENRLAMIVNLGTSLRRRQLDAERRDRLAEMGAVPA